MNINLFARLLGCAVFFATAQTFGPNPYNLLLHYFKPLSFIIALAVMFAPHRKILVKLLIAAVLVDFALLMPEAPNHRHVMLFFALMLGLSLKNESRSESLFESLTLPAIRLTTILIYFFAAFAKLNSGYLNFETSCSIEFYRNIHALLPFFPEPSMVGVPVIWGSLAIELLIPILLIFRPAWGVILGVGFHSFLALDVVKYFINFSTVMIVGLMAFIPTNSLAEAAKKESKLLRKLAPLFFLALTAVALFSFYLKCSQSGIIYPVIIFRHVLWFILFFIFCFFLVRAFKNTKLNYTLALRVKLPYSIIIFLVILNGLSPYLGLKTRTSFNMYSNMEITSYDSNHEVIPRSLDIFGYLKEVEAGNRPNGFLARNFLSFRPVTREKNQKCIW